MKAGGQASAVGRCSQQGPTVAERWRGQSTTEQTAAGHKLKQQECWRAPEAGEEVKLSLGRGLSFPLLALIHDLPGIRHVGWGSGLRLRSFGQACRSSVDPNTKYPIQNKPPLITDSPLYQGVHQILYTKSGVHLPMPIWCTPPLFSCGPLWQRSHQQTFMPHG